MLASQKIALKDLNVSTSDTTGSELRELQEQTTTLHNILKAAIQCPEMSAHDHHMGLYLGSFLPPDLKYNWQWYRREFKTSDFLLWVQGPNQTLMRRVDVICRSVPSSTESSALLCETIATSSIDKLLLKAKDKRIHR